MWGEKYLGQTKLFSELFSECTIRIARQKEENKIGGGENLGENQICRFITEWGKKSVLYHNLVQFS